MNEDTRAEVMREWTDGNITNERLAKIIKNEMDRNRTD